ncbi:hypothetical protein B0A52_08632 [Exophiala mesophila]|uniref:Xylanolytic transcriptional activator regulatory domain-containing protein n=1 Tax=Exophiala mesophila TaxID=212818 RepID=A0A438MWA0_EXOME|nr:hypothetical protein B0A52_08632 [Exophiala mesophila]
MDLAPDAPRRSTKRKRHETDAAPTRRSTNACHRCKNKKLKCHFLGLVQDKCAACTKAGAGRTVISLSLPLIDALPECIYDVPTDPLPRAQIATLESELRVARTQSFLVRGSLHESDGRRGQAEEPRTVRSETGRGGAGEASDAGLERPAPFSFPELVERQSTSELTKFNMLQGVPTNSELQAATLPKLPSEETANMLLESAYLYTQSRWCLVDWAYFARALKYLHAVLRPQNLTTVQGLLAMCQYYARAVGGPSLWHLSGIITRLCIELGYHRKSKREIGAQDPRTLEQQKRAFCVISTMAGRPFGIQDADIDVHVPVDVWVESTDNEHIRTLQLQQEAGDTSPSTVEMTSMSSALHHLRMYRLISEIWSRFYGPRALPPTQQDIQTFLAALDEWKAQAPHSESPIIPKYNAERRHGFYLQALLHAIRPVLMQEAVEPGLLRLCAEKAVDACETVKTLSLSPQTYPALVDLYQTFYTGTVVLQCLALQPDILPSRRVVRAIVACSSGLAVYSRHFPSGAPFMELFEKLSEPFLGQSDNLDEGWRARSTMPRMKRLLQEIMSSDPSETARMLKSLAAGDTAFLASTSVEVDDAVPAYHPPMTGDFPNLTGLSEATMPLDMSFDVFSSMNCTYQELIDFWHTS